MTGTAGYSTFLRGSPRWAGKWRLCLSPTACGERRVAACWRRGSNGRTFRSVHLGFVHTSRRFPARVNTALILSGRADAPHAIIGDRVARSLGVPHVIDLYDDYESFGLTKIPGMRPAFRNACRRASAITVVSEVLAGIVSERISFARRIHHLPNGVAPFQSCLGRAGLLEFLGLPPGSRLVGAVGALDDGRGIGDLFDAFDILSAEMPDLHLVLVGKERGRSLLRRGPRIHRLGVVSHSLAMSILAALDVSVVCNRDGAFARSCHPMKLVEAISVQTPVVAAAVGEVRRLLASRPDSLFEPGDPVSLARRIAGHLRQPKALDPALAKRWDEVSKKLSDLLFEILLDKP